MLAVSGHDVVSLQLMLYSVHHGKGLCGRSESFRHSDGRKDTGDGMDEEVRYGTKSKSALEQVG